MRQGVGFALKQGAKLIPVYGQIGGAAAASLSSFAFTYALGYAACVYLKGRRTGVAASNRDIQDAYRAALVKAFDIFRASREPAEMIDPGLLKAFRRELIAVALLVIPPLLLIPLGGAMAARTRRHLGVPGGRPRAAPRSPG